MTPTEVEEALKNLSEAPFDRDRFPFDFLSAIGRSDSTISRLKSEDEKNYSDLGGLLLRKDLHFLLSEKGKCDDSILALERSPATQKHKVRFILTTDGADFAFMDLQTGIPYTMPLKELTSTEHLPEILPLAGIELVSFSGERSIDVKATSQLNKLYVELTKKNPALLKDEEGKNSLNHFMARLIFCFFAEDTGIFKGKNAFSERIIQLSQEDASDQHLRLEEAFTAMNIPMDEKEKRQALPTWTQNLPYVNGGLFAEDVKAPLFSKPARSYFRFLAELDWKAVNPDIFGSMIQAIADPEERAHLGMHYTSVSNILKVLNPLFLTELWEEFEKAKASKKKLKALRLRLSKIRVFDPACGSGNFLVIAYKELRRLENEIMKALNTQNWQSLIPLNNFRGIEVRHFAAEIARLALVIAQYQTDVLYVGQLFAKEHLIPLEKEHWVTCGNALELDWKALCPSHGKKARLKKDGSDLFQESIILEDDFESEDGEVYICGNPPYVGSTFQTKAQKADMKLVFHGKVKSYASLDYVAAWFYKAAEYEDADFAFVSTNSLNQGQSVARLWPPIFEKGFQIDFAVLSFKWQNLAKHNAGVTVSIIGLSQDPKKEKRLFSVDEQGEQVQRTVPHINAYLVAAPHVIIKASSQPVTQVPPMFKGNQATDGGHLFLSFDEVQILKEEKPGGLHFIRRIVGSREFIHNEARYCLWISDEERAEAKSIPWISERLKKVKAMRQKSKKMATQAQAIFSHRFTEIRQKGTEHTIVIPASPQKTGPTCLWASFPLVSL